MSDTEKKLAFLLATSPHLDTVSGSYDEAARDLVANGVVPVVMCKDCKMRCPESISVVKHCTLTGIQTDDDDFCSYGERMADDADD